jgi:hypothetical protein
MYNSMEVKKDGYLALVDLHQNHFKGFGLCPMKAIREKR